MRGCYRAPPRVCSKEGGEAVPRTPWLGYGIQPVSGPLTPCTEGKTPVDGRCEPGGSVFRAVKPRIGNRCTASGDLYIRTSGINRVLFSYCFRQFLRFRSDIHCFDSWRLARDFSVTASLTVIYRYFSANRDEDSKVFRWFGALSRVCLHASLPRLFCFSAPPGYVLLYVSPLLKCGLFFPPDGMRIDYEGALSRPIHAFT